MRLTAGPTAGRIPMDRATTASHRGAARDLPVRAGAPPLPLPRNPGADHGRANAVGVSEGLPHYYVAASSGKLADVGG
jgi:hypothetical protein